MNTLGSLEFQLRLGLGSEGVAMMHAAEPGHGDDLAEPIAMAACQRSVLRPRSLGLRKLVRVGSIPKVLIAPIAPLLA
jgi:hypothetical protein